MEGFGATGTAIKDFITNNPGITTAGAAIIAYGLYKFFGHEHRARAPSKRSALAGISKAHTKAPMKFVLR